MYIKFGALLVISAHIYSTLALPPCTCARNLKPVCGSDGVEYGNECMLECAEYTTGTNITVVKEGPCEESLPQAAVPICMCTLQYAPVCGSNGQTYANECALNCEKYKSASLKVEHAGECKTTPVSENDV